jgi:hypothetical protein
MIYLSLFTSNIQIKNVEEKKSAEHWAFEVTYMHTHMYITCSFSELKVTIQTSPERNYAAATPSWHAHHYEQLVLSEFVH